MTFCVADSKIDELVKVNKTQKQLLYFLLKSKTKFNLDKCIKALQISSRTFYRNVEVLLNKNLIIKKANDDKLYHNESDIIYQLEPNFEIKLKEKLVTKCHKPTDKMAHNDCQNVTSPTYIYKSKSRVRDEFIKPQTPYKGASVVCDEISQTKTKGQNENKSQLKLKAQRIATELNNTSDEFISKLDEFLNNRNKKHKITDAYISDLINELKQIPNPLIAINKCLAKGWITCESHYFKSNAQIGLNHNYALHPNLQRQVENNELTGLEAQQKQNLALALARIKDKEEGTNYYEQMKNQLRKDNYENKNTTKLIQCI
ncbi:MULTISPECIES: hypothetical protein [unclassified Campylobacter]|uniref:hypothetical protein n=1 Tax=unclassified Campylobacter TaxID=2593542 RepID=UPI001BD991B0|nr:MULTISPECIES: hypothetical protein [unclassified Campylobacter]MBT0880157.1 hypothetical protein [Campylobacter sp. 2018MI27]MBT0884778.1 hypothetical protein [Campylobacter sp. 2018MI10]